MSEHSPLIDRYIACWNEADAARRRALIAETFTEGAAYCDPMLQGEGHAGIDALIAAAQQHFPGLRFSRRGGADAHHDRLRFSWELGPDGCGAGRRRHRHGGGRAGWPARRRHRLHRFRAEGVSAMERIIPSDFLRRVLLADAVSSGAMGLLLALLAGPLARWFGLPAGHAAGGRHLPAGLRAPSSWCSASGAPRRGCCSGW